VTGNDITGNRASNTYGLYVGGGWMTGQNNIVKGNTIQNYTVGLYLNGVSPNSIYLNIINGTTPVTVTGAAGYNAWNNSAYGNYYATPSGTGFSQDPATCMDTDHNLICDLPYTLSATGPNIDYLPLATMRTGPPPDSEPPTSSLTVISSEQIVYGMYPSDVTVRITSVDNPIQGATGVNNIKYRYTKTNLNGQVVEQTPTNTFSGASVDIPLTCACAQCTAPDNICTNPCCTYDIEYWAEDNLNYIEDSQTSTVKIDKRAANETVVPSQPTVVTNNQGTAKIEIPENAYSQPLDFIMEPSEQSFAPTTPGMVPITQPLDLGPQCYLIESETDCGDTVGCEFNYDDGRCQSKRLGSDSPATITMPGDCSPGSPYGDLVTQVIAKYSPWTGWAPLTTCTDYNDIGRGRLSCLEEDGRVTIWDTGACTIAAQTWSFSPFIVLGMKNVFSIGDASAIPGDIISIPISLDNSANIYAMQFVFLYPGLLQYQGITQTDRTSGAIEAVNPSVSGVLRLAALYGRGSPPSTSLESGNGDIYNVNFKVSMRAAPGEYPLSLTGLKTGNIATAPFPYTVRNGTLTIRAGPPDTEPPITTASFSGTGKDGWFSSNVTVELVGIDDVYIDRIYYCLDTPSAPQDCGNTGSFASVESNYYTFNVSTAGNEGRSTIYYYSVDLAGNAELSVKSSSFGIDTIAPTTSDNVPPWWINYDLSITVDASDSVPGIETSGANITYLCVDQLGQCNPSPEPASLTFSDGVYYIRYYSIDNAGNVELVKTKAISIDGTAPETSATVAGTFNDQGWTNSPVDITLSGTDAVSGIYATFQCTSFEGNECPAYTQTDVPGQGHQLISGEGRFTYRYYSEDNGGRISPYSEGYEYSSYDAPNTGNAETVKEIAVKIDTSAPSTTMESSCSQSSCTVTLSAADPALASEHAGSGVQKIMYAAEGGAWQEYTSQFTVTGEGRNHIRFYAMDNAGNQEAVQQGVAIIDTTPPVVNITVIGTEGKRGWYNSPSVTVIVKAIETTSDIDQLCTDVNSTDVECDKNACGTG